MDLLQCPACRQRFLVTDAARESRWSCANCQSGLELVVRSIPGAAEGIAAALDARLLEFPSPPAPLPEGVPSGDGS